MKGERIDWVGRAADSALTRRARNVHLRPVTDGDMDFLFYLANVDDNLLRWRLRGRTTSPAAFQNFLWSNTELQFLIVRNQDGSPIGHVCTYQTDELARNARVAIALDPNVQGRGWALRGAWLFFNYLFFECPFEIVNFEMPKFNAVRLGRFLEEFTTEEGRLIDAAFWRGEFTNVRIMSMTRADWQRALSSRAGRFMGAT